ncbi:hypothetical protein [Fibrobacter sp.]
MNTEKKEYVAPKMESVELKHNASLLACSGSNCEAGFVFPHEQDPIA